MPALTLRRAVMAVVPCVVLGSAGVASAHPFGWRVSQDGAGDLQIEFLFDRIHKIRPDTAGRPGWTESGLEFREWDQTDAARDIYPVEAGALVTLEVVDFDPGFFFHDPNDLMTPIGDEVGERWRIGKGGTDFLVFPMWRLDPTAPGFSPDGGGDGIWEASFRLVDERDAEAHGASPVYTFRTQLIPAPGALAALGLGALAATRRRR